MVFPKPGHSLEPEQGALVLPNKPSIALLPFANLCSEPGQEYFVDGMVEEIVRALSCIDKLFVIAANSSFEYRNSSAKPGQTGRQLGVRYLLEGSVEEQEILSVFPDSSSTLLRERTFGLMSSRGSCRKYSIFRTKWRPAWRA